MSLSGHGVLVGGGACRPPFWMRGSPATWTRVRICAETYGFARQNTRGGSMHLILIVQ